MKSRRLERGQSFVEMALGMTVLIILLGGLFDVGRAFLILIVVENATGEGALYGVMHPECLAPDHSSSICQGTESVKGRVVEESKPLVQLSTSDVTLSYEKDGAAVTVTSGADIAAGVRLYVEVEYDYSPITPIGFALWGSTATVRATASQQILSPPPMGYDY